MRKAIPIALTPEEKGKLVTIVRSAVATVRDVQRARIVLLAAAGKENREIAAQVGLSVKSVSLWRRRFAQQRLAGLQDQVGRGRKRTHGPEKVEEIITATLTTTPKHAAHWSTRAMAKQAGVGQATSWGHQRQVRQVAQEGMAGPASPLSGPFQPHFIFLVECGGTIFCRTYSKTPAPRGLLQCVGFNYGHQCLPGRTKPATQTFYLDENG